MEEIRRMSRRALVTGCAGFIGSHLTESLIADDWDVIGIDNLSTGLESNLANIPRGALDFYHDAITNLAQVGQLDASLEECDVVFHLAALGSVPRSIEDPFSSHEANVDSFVELLEAMRRLDRRPRLVFASSSSIYGDCPRMTKRETDTGFAISPYAATKQVMETYARIYAQTYGLNIVGLRYFNVYGPRQRADSAYAAVIPTWTNAMLAGAPVTVFGTGNVPRRDFTAVADVVRATRKAGAVLMDAGIYRAFNVGCGRTVSIREIFDTLAELTGYRHPPVLSLARAGDIVESCADTTLMEHALGFKPDGSTEALRRNLHDVVEWMRRNADSGNSDRSAHHG